MEQVKWTEKPYEYGREFESECRNYMILMEKDNIKEEININGIEIKKKNKDYIVYVGTHPNGSYRAEALKTGLINDFLEHMNYISTEPGINFGFDTEKEAVLFVENVKEWLNTYFVNKM